MPKGVDKERFEKFKKYYDPDIFREAGKRIREMARAADKFTIEERIERISAIFNTFRNPDKETVLTPWRVVNMHMSDCLGGWCFYDEAFKQPLSIPRYVNQGKVTHDVFRPEAHVLEINSKSGLYPLYVAYNIYRARVEAMKQKYGEIGHAFAQSLWDATIEENILVVCKTPMAKSITKRTLAGFRNIRVNAQYYKDLIQNISEHPEAVVNTFRDGKHFWKINQDTNMKLDAIVGNPPYQVMGGSGGNNDAPIYQYFANIATRITSKYSSLIMPSRWFAAGRENLLGDFRRRMLTCGNIAKLVAYSNGSILFKNVEIKGGVCYYLENVKEKGLCKYSLIGDGGVQCIETDLSQFDILIREPRLVSIVQKVERKRKLENDGTVDTIMSADTPFGIPSNPRTSTKTPFPVYEHMTEMHDVLLYHIENQKRKIEYVSSIDIKKNKHDIEKDKVFIPIAGGSGNDDKVLGDPEYAPKHSVCSQSYLYAAFNTEKEARNFVVYVKSRFFRVLVSAIKITQSAPSRVYRFVPLQDFTRPWTDADLYAKYHLTDEEIQFIESMIKPME